MEPKSRRPKIYHEDTFKGQVQQNDAKNILLLYLCGLGYSPIRHILGMRYSETSIARIVTNHKLGRREVAGDEGYLCCKAQNPYSDFTAMVVNTISNYYGTVNDEYITNMVATRLWHDESKGVSNDAKNACRLEE